MSERLWMLGFLVGGILIATDGLGRLFPAIPWQQRFWAVVDMGAAAAWIAIAIRIGSR